MGNYTLLCGIDKGSPWGELSPKVTEGWPGDCLCLVGHPSPAARELPSRGAFTFPAATLLLRANNVRPYTLF